MKVHASAPLALVLAAFALRGELEAAVVPHGGVYGITPGSLPPKQPVGPRPVLPGPRGPVLASHAETWRESWSREKGRYLVSTVEQRLARGIRPVTESQVTGEIVPALFQTLETCAHDELVADLLLALARVGRDPAGIELRTIVRGRLQARSPWVRDNAARALDLLARDAGTTVRPRGVEATARRALLEALARDADAESRARSALALGMLLRDCRSLSGSPIEPREVEALKALLSVRRGEARGAAAIALGLAGARDARADLSTLFEEHWGREPICGPLAVALALLGDTDAKPSIQALIDGPTRETGRMRDAADALGLVGDGASALVMVRRIGTDEVFGREVYDALADAITTIGDSGSVTPLTALLEDRSRHPSARGAAARALAGIASKR
ncbi:MAG: hypothetical protein HZB39_06310 [Planctomycetes bacterium]|nr:hypothetical protein [Planctomycetota bacterium]